MATENQTDSEIVVSVVNVWVEHARECFHCGEYIGEVGQKCCYVLDNPDLDLPFCSEVCARDYAEEYAESAEE